MNPTRPRVGRVLVHHSDASGYGLGLRQRTTALHFDGAPGLGARAERPALDITGPITLEAWIRPTTTDGLRDIVAHGYMLAPPPRCTCGATAATTSAPIDGDRPGVAVDRCRPSDLNTWVHLAGVYDGTAWHLYRNGVLAGDRRRPGRRRARHRRLDDRRLAPTRPTAPSPATSTRSGCGRWPARAAEIAAGMTPRWPAPSRLGRGVAVRRHHDAATAPPAPRRRDRRRSRPPGRRTPRTRSSPPSATRRARPCRGCPPGRGPTWQRRSSSSTACSRRRPGLPRRRRRTARPEPRPDHRGRRASTTSPRRTASSPAACSTTAPTTTSRTRSGWTGRQPGVRLRGQRPCRAPVHLRRRGPHAGAFRRVAVTRRHNVEVDTPHAGPGLGRRRGRRLGRHRLLRRRAQVGAVSATTARTPGPAARPR